MYAAELGRFITRDPLPQSDAPDILYDNNWFGDWLTTMHNLYGYASSMPTTRTDAYGLIDALVYDADGNSSADVTFPVLPPPLAPVIGRGAPQVNGRNQRAFERFSKWYSDERQRGIGWVTKLLPCPCTICVNGQIVNPNPSAWTDPSSSSRISDKFYWTSGYHPGGAYEIRSTGIGVINGSGQQCVYDMNGKLISSAPAGGTADYVSPSGSTWGHVDADVTPYDDARTLGQAFLILYFTVRPINGGQGCQ